MDDDSRSCKQTLAVLTLERHKDGIWIQRLVKSLQELISCSESTTGPRCVGVDVVVLEEYMSEPMCVSESESSSSTNWIGIVNRVSDAAVPWEVKTCMALLHVARHVWQIPTFNGPDAYALCTSKWCHHVLFTKARLSSPVTVATMQHLTRGENHHDAAQRALQKLHEESEKRSKNDGPRNTHYLIKPNAGGFGAGIVQHRMDTQKQEDIPVYADRIMLLQNYVPPKNDKIYRVWFLLGKVQCATERTIPTSNDEVQASQFTSGCAGGAACSKSDVNGASNESRQNLSYTVPEDVRHEIEDQLLPVLPKDAHCGSVEFLLDSSTTDSEQPKRLYFDLNLLSTLPVVEEPTQEGGAIDPWLDLARAILDVIGCISKK